MEPNDVFDDINNKKQSSTFFKNSNDDAINKMMSTSFYKNHRQYNPNEKPSNHVLIRQTK